MKRNTMAVVVLSAAGAMLLASCGGGSQNDSLHTYNTYLSTSPTNWNVHNWQTNDESYIPSFTEIGFYDTILNSTKDGYEFVTEMANEFPKEIAKADVSDAEYEKYYGGTGNIGSGMVWDIALNDKAVWEDGTAITANDYVKSMERQLDPKYVNFRADSYYNGNLVLAHAENFYKQGRQTIEPAYDYINTETGKVPDDSGFWYISLGKYTPYVSAVFSNADADTTFYTVLNNRSNKINDAVELAAQRITDGVGYYLWKNVDHSNSDKKSDWEKVTKPSDVKKEMFAEGDPVDIALFDTTEVLTRKNVNDSSWDETNQERYTMSALKKDIKTFVDGLRVGAGAGKFYSWELPLFTKITHEIEGDPLTIDDVGIKAVDDYKLRLFLSKSITSLNLKFALSGNWLVNVPLYDRLTTELRPGYSGTTYATKSVDNYMSYGPYKLSYFEAGKKIDIVRNDKWYGYSDGKHVGQFQMDAISTSIYKEHSTAMAAFEKGNLDDIDLTIDDMGKYGSSSRRTTTYESYTQKISFNTDRTKLAERQVDGGLNKTVIANTDFRKGLSLALDRNGFAANATSGSKGFTGLLNDLYLSDVAKGTSYRSTPQGQAVYGKVYGEMGGESLAGEVSALPENKVGYNRSLAVDYLVKGFKAEYASTAEKHLVPGQKVDIEFRVYDDSSETTIKMFNQLNTAWTGVIDAAAAKLVEEGVITDKGQIGLKFHMVKDEDYYSSAKNGGYDMIFSIWGGAAIDPYGLMHVYCDKTFESTCEYGFKGKQDQAFLEFDSDGDGVLENDSFNGWYSTMTSTLNEAKYGDELNPGDEKYEEWKKIHEQRITILSELEAGILNRFETIPVVARGTSSLLGFKVENATNTYVSLIGYGGIRFMKFNYTDGEWKAFVAEKGGNLSELYRTFDQ